MTWSLTQRKLLKHFKQDKFQLDLFISAMLNTYIYTTFSAMRILNTFMIRNHDAFLGGFDFSAPHEELYAKLGQTIAYILPNRGNVQCTLSFNEENIYVTFRGSIAPMDFYDDVNLMSRTIKNPCKDRSECTSHLNYNKKPCVKHDTRCTDPDGDLKIHRGFLEHYDRIDKGSDHILTLLNTFVNFKRHRQKKIIITGHSLGAATAAICAANLTARNPELIDRVKYIFLFGCPNIIGNDYFAKIIHTYYPDRCFNCIYENDVVTTSIPGYSSPVGTIIPMGRRRDYFYKNVINHLPHNYVRAIYDSEY
jgi:hypothetical protein